MSRQVEEAQSRFPPWQLGGTNPVYPSTYVYIYTQRIYIYIYDQVRFHSLRASQACCLRTHYSLNPVLNQLTRLASICSGRSRNRPSSTCGRCYREPLGQHKEHPHCHDNCSLCCLDLQPSKELDDKISPNVSLEDSMSMAGITTGRTIYDL